MNNSYENIKKQVYEELTNNNQELFEYRYRLKTKIVNNLLTSTMVERDEEGKRLIDRVRIKAELQDLSSCETISEKCFNQAAQVEMLLATNTNPDIKQTLCRLKALYEVYNEWISFDIYYDLEIKKKKGEYLNDLSYKIYKYYTTLAMQYLNEVQKKLNSLNLKTLTLGRK